MTKIHCLVNNKDESIEMEQKLQKIGLPFEMYQSTNETLKIQSHLQMFKKFYKSKEKYAIFCDGNILIHKDLKNVLPGLIQEFEKHSLNVLLLGYYCPVNIDKYIESLPSTLSEREKKSYIFNNLLSRYKEFGIYTYPQNQWGSHMYLISRKYVKHLLNYITKDETSNPDGLVTKIGKGALVSPMIAMESPSPDSIDDDKKKLIQATHKYNFVENIYI